MSEQNIVERLDILGKAISAEGRGDPISQHSAATVFDAKAEIERLRAENEKLRERCDGYKGQVKVGGAEIDRYRAVTTEQHAEIERLRAEIERLKPRNVGNDQPGPEPYWP